MLSTDLNLQPVGLRSLVCDMHVTCHSPDLLPIFSLQHQSPFSQQESLSQSTAVLHRAVSNYNSPGKSHLPQTFALWPGSLWNSILIVVILSHPPDFYCWPSSGFSKLQGKLLLLTDLAVHTRSSPVLQHSFAVTTGHEYLKEGRGMGSQTELLWDDTLRHICLKLFPFTPHILTFQVVLKFRICIALSNTVSPESLDTMSHPHVEPEHFSALNALSSESGNKSCLFVLK